MNTFSFVRVPIARIFLLLSLMAATTSAHATQELREVISKASNDAVDELARLRASDELDTESALEVIQKYLSPNIHFEALAQNSVGKHWRTADAEQKAQLVDEFRTLIENTYAVTMSKFTTQTAAVVRSRKLDDGTISVRTRISNRGREAYIENIMGEVNGRWGIVDIKVEDISLLSNYRRQFTSVIRSRGVDGLIEALKKKNESS